MITGYIVSITDPDASEAIRPFAQLFIRMIQMIIAPLLFATLVAGIAGAGHFKDVGRMGLRAIIYFEVVTTLALLIGLLAVNIMQPGVGLTLPAPTGPPPITAAAADRGRRSSCTSSRPRSSTRWRAATCCRSSSSACCSRSGSACSASAAGRSSPWCEVLAETMFKVTHIIMLYAPIGVGAAIAYTIGRSGLGVLWNLGYLVLTLYVALTVFVLLVLVPVMLLFRIPIGGFARAIKDPALIAFSTTSSEAALPLALERMEQFGVPRPIVSFILPLGYSFNLDGSTLYLSLAAIFVAQAANVDLTVGQQITMLLTLMLTSKGVAGVPRASLVILAGTLASYNLPLEGITLILGVDAIMDMARTTVNVTGNCLASAVVARWEGQFDAQGHADHRELRVRRRAARLTSGSRRLTFATISDHSGVILERHASWPGS